MKKRIAVLSMTAIAVALFAIAPMVIADPPRFGRPGGFASGPGDGVGAGPGGGGPMMMGIFNRLSRLQEELNLSGGQVEQLTSIATALRTQNEPLREQLQGGMREITKSLIENPESLASAQAALAQRAAAEAALRGNSLVALSNSMKVLTADQRAKLAELQAERAGRRGRRGR